jgi:hypothetical protein
MQRATIGAAATIGLAIFLIPTLLLASYWYWYESRSEQRWEYRGSDPSIIVDEGTMHGGFPVTVVGGVLGYEPDGRCLYLEVDPSFVASVQDPLSGTQAPLRVPIVWPKATRSVQVDGLRGVAVDAFVGRIGGRVLLEGDEVWGQGWFASVGVDLHLAIGGPSVGRCTPEAGVAVHFTDRERLPYRGENDPDVRLAELP